LDRWGWGPIGFCLTLLALAAAWWEVLHQDFASNPGILALLFVFTGYVIGERLIGWQTLNDEHKIHHEIESARDDIVGHITRSFSVTFIGDHKTGLQVVAEKLANAQHAKDTYFRMYPDTSVFGYQETGEKLYNAYTELAKRGGSVELIISKHNLEPVREFAKNLTSLVINRRSIPQFRIYELDNGNIPIPNIVILSYDAKQRELFFGWNFKDREGIVFSSTDEKTIGYFDYWFESLKDVARQYDISQGFDRLAYIDRKTGRRIEIDSEVNSQLPDQRRSEGISESERGEKLGAEG
jgi:hypothetical protein